MISHLRGVLADDTGGPLIEYALTMLLVSVVTLNALALFASVLNTFFGTTSSTLPAVAQQNP